MGPKRFRCLLCRDADPNGFDFESVEAQCPRCKSVGHPAVLELDDVHFMVADQANGPILGMYGRKWKVVCKPNATNPKGRPMTPMVEAVTCRACKDTEEFKKAEAQSGYSSTGPGGIEILT